MAFFQATKEVGSIKLGRNPAVVDDPEYLLDFEHILRLSRLTYTMQDYEQSPQTVIPFVRPRIVGL